MSDGKAALRLIEDRIGASSREHLVKSGFEFWDGIVVRNRKMRMSLGACMSGNRVMLIRRGMAAFRAGKAAGRERRREEGLGRAIKEGREAAMAGIARHSRREKEAKGAAIKNVLLRWSTQAVRDHHHHPRLSLPSPPLGTRGW